MRGLCWLWMDLEIGTQLLPGAWQAYVLSHPPSPIVELCRRDWRTWVPKHVLHEEPGGD